jgi:hypothetical protein
VQVVEVEREMVDLLKQAVQVEVVAVQASGGGPGSTSGGAGNTPPVSPPQGNPGNGRRSSKLELEVVEVLDLQLQVELMVHLLLEDQGLAGTNLTSIFTGLPNSGVYAGGGGGGTYQGGTAGTGGTGGGGAAGKVVSCNSGGAAGTANTGGRWWWINRTTDSTNRVGGNRRFRYRYRKRIKQGQWIVATESTI